MKASHVTSGVSARVAVVIAAIAGCTASGRQPISDTPSPPHEVVADTLRGQVSEMGADPTTWIALVPPGGKAVRLSGKIAALRAVTGADVWVSGAREHDGFAVAVFEVRGVNGRPVDDGVVEVQSDGVTLRLRSGSIRSIPNAPAALRTMTGARIWVTRPVPDQAPSFGVIEAAFR